MHTTRFALIPLALAALAACGGDAEHNYPDEEGSAAASAPAATLQDSLVTGEAIQTVPPPVESAEPTGVATGDTLHGAQDAGTRP
jgi:hypothetical protein